MGFAKKANDAATTYSIFDAVGKAKEADRLLDLGKGMSIPKTAALGAADAAGYGLPGGGLTGAIGGVLSLLGGVNDVRDMLDNGINYDNGLSLTGNAAGLGSALLGATPAGIAMGTYSATTTGATAGNNWVKEKGIFGERDTEYDSRGNRGYDDLAADFGRWVRNGTGSDLLGGVGTIASAGVLGPAALCSGVMSAGESAGRWILDLDNPLLEGIGPQIAAARTAANSNAKEGK